MTSMTTTPPGGELREIPKRPFGVYVLVFILLAGIFSAALEIFRLHSGLEGIWVSADQFLRDRTGFVALASRLISNPLLLTITNGAIIAVWALIILGLWFLKRWAWVLLMIFTGIALTYALVRYFSGDADYLGMLVNVAVAFYLNDHSVQRAFARKATKVSV